MSIKDKVEAGYRRAWTVGYAYVKGAIGLGLIAITSFSDLLGDPNLQGVVKGHLPPDWFDYVLILVAIGTYLSAHHPRKDG